MALLNPFTVATNATAIFTEFTNSQFGKDVIEGAKQRWPEYKTDPGYDTTDEAAGFIVDKIENNHVLDFDIYRDPLYRPETLVTMSEFNDLDETGASIRYHLTQQMIGLLLRD
jgi:hypothetical protein